MTPSLRPNRERVLAEIAHLGTISDVPPPAVTRILYTPTDMAARRYLIQLAEEAGLCWRTDAIGNWFVRLEGTEPALPAVATGSHTDAIPHAGRYDGVVGVLGGLEVLRTVKESGIAPRRSLELVMFTSEEPTRFGMGCLGSRALTALVPWSELRELTDTEGTSLDEARTSAGFRGPLESVEMLPDAYACFLELHIEQGPFLEQADCMIGAVIDIVASSTVRVAVTGESGHAGTVAMPDRRDALAGAAEIILSAEAAAQSHAHQGAVATVGMLEVHPGASNSIPGRVEFTLDMRCRAEAVRDRMMGEIRASIASETEARGLAYTWEILNHDPGSKSDPYILQTIADCARACGHPVMEMTSRAYHDTVFMAQRFPTAMIFIPSKHGYSHRPEEYSSPDEIMVGIEVLGGVMLELAAS